MSQGISDQRLALYSGPVQSCSYLPDQQSQSWFVDPAAALTPALYSQLLAKGYRRSGEIVYRPACPECQACVPVRVPVSRFRPKRWVKRNRRINHDLTLSWHHRGIDSETLALYQRYQQARHPNGEMNYQTADEVERFFYCDWLEPMTLEWRQGSQLVSVAVVDRVPGALSAVYSFFDPAHSWRGLGNYSVLCEIALAAEWECQWLYLGYWIEACPKMSYKQRFRPLEAFKEENWRILE